MRPNLRMKWQPELYSEVCPNKYIIARAGNIYFVKTIGLALKIYDPTALQLYLY